MANIKLLPKPGKKNVSSLTGYRAISLLNSIGKMNEKVINEILLKAAVTTYFTGQVRFQKGSFIIDGVLLKLVSGNLDHYRNTGHSVIVI